LREKSSAAPVRGPIARRLSAIKRRRRHSCQRRYPCPIVECPSRRSPRS
jgi:hypothetical protein